MSGQHVITGLRTAQLKSRHRDHLSCTHDIIRKGRTKSRPSDQVHHIRSRNADQTFPGNRGTVQPVIHLVRRHHRSDGQRLLRDGEAGRFDGRRTGIQISLHCIGSRIRGCIRTGRVAGSTRPRILKDKVGRRAQLRIPRVQRIGGTRRIRLGDSIIFQVSGSRQRDRWQRCARGPLDVESPVGRARIVRVGHRCHHGIRPKVARNLSGTVVSHIHRQPCGINGGHQSLRRAIVSRRGGGHGHCRRGLVHHKCVAHRCRIVVSCVGRIERQLQRLGSRIQHRSDRLIVVHGSRHRARLGCTQFGPAQGRWIGNCRHGTPDNCGISLVHHQGVADGGCCIVPCVIRHEVRRQRITSSLKNRPCRDRPHHAVAIGDRSTNRTRFRRIQLPS